MDLKVRWMDRADCPEVARIMRSCGEEADERRIDRLVSKTGVVCVVAVAEGKILGFMAYDIGRISKIKVLNLSVDAESRRIGVGTSLVETLTPKLNKKRSKIELSVSEYNLTAQLFLKSVGFRAVSVHPGDEGSSDYKFMYKFDEGQSSEP